MPAPESSGMSCDQARRQIERMIEECDLKEIERALLFSHLRGCATCKTILENYRRLESRVKEAFVPLDTRPDFTQRLLRALPGPASAEAPNWMRAKGRATTDLKDDDSRRALIPPSKRRRWSWRAYALPLSVAALVLIGLGGMLIKYAGRHAPNDASPLVSEVNGTGIRTHVGNSASLKPGNSLSPDDLIISGSDPLTITLVSAQQVLARVTMAPNSNLQARNRHQFIVARGAAFFEVRKDRPREAGEFFEVEGPGLGTVRVTGTSFGVDLRNTAAPVVVVKEGTVEVRQSGGLPVTVTGENELDVKSGKVVASNSSARLNWMLPQVQIAAPWPSAAQVPPQNPPVPATAAIAAKPEWNDVVQKAQFKDRNLSDGIAMLAEARNMALPEQLQELRAHVQGFDKHLSFSIYSRMPLSTAVAWIARDAGTLRFELNANAGKAYFKTVAMNEPVAAPSNGLMPESVRQNLERTIDELPGESRELCDVLDRLAHRSEVTIIADRALRDAFAIAVKKVPPLAGERVRQKLELLLEHLNANAAWCDEVLYIASPSRIEALTRVERISPGIQALLGQPALREWNLSFNQLVTQQNFPAAGVATHGSSLPLLSDSELAGKSPYQILETVRDGETTRLKYRAGVLGDAVLNRTLATLSGESAEVSNAAAFSQPLDAGPIESVALLLENKIKPLQQLAPSPAGIKIEPLGRGAYVSKGQTLGDALQWATWLSGCGLRQTEGALIIDSVEACYGKHELQVLSLAPILEKHPQLADELPRQFSQMLRAFHPYFFPDRTYALAGKVAFEGNRRQLMLAQKLRRALKEALDAGQVNLQSWRPRAIAQIEANLARKFSNSPLNGRFDGLLRNSGLSAQLQCSVLVHPGDMKQAARVDIQDGQITKRETVGEIMNQLAERAGLKMVIEGDVILLLPVKP